MTRILLFLLLICGYTSQAQNYQCLQAGVKRYYSNPYNYLRGMRIDSVRTSGSDVIYFPFHTVRGQYKETWLTPVDSNGGSWLGKQVVQKADGTFLFDNFWGDTVTIKTQAQPGDSWIFYNDTNRRYYTASLTSADTATVLGSADSVKTIIITAYDDTGAVPADPLNGFSIILSKNHGFAKVFDLYTFPYRRPDTAYTQYRDFYFDYISGMLYCGRTAPWYPSSSFSLTSLVNPTHTDLYDWNVGDVFEYSFFTDHIPNDGSFPYGYYFDSITAKTAVPGGEQYTFAGWIAKQHTTYPPPIGVIGYNSGFPYPYDTSGNSGTFTVSNSLLIDTSLMPEETRHKYLYYYYPDDTTYCRVSHGYALVEGGINNAWLFCSEGFPTVINYKTGIGLVKYNWNYIYGAPPLILDTSLRYYVKSGTPCGHYTYPSPINYIAGLHELATNEFAVIPNPATQYLTINAPGATSYTVTVVNTLGQIVKVIATTKSEVTVDVAQLPPGIYDVSITSETGLHHEKVVIMH